MLNHYLLGGLVVRGRGVESFLQRKYAFDEVAVICDWLRVIPEVNGAVDLGVANTFLATVVSCSFLLAQTGREIWKTE
jgi:hypothetical protein